MATHIVLWGLVFVAACRPAPGCGDGVLQVGEECDDGDGNSDWGACTLDCKAAFCGDGLVNGADERCDDSNAEHNDGCTSTCQREPRRFNLKDADARVVGTTDEWMGTHVAGAGDVDGDGFDDVLVSAPAWPSGAEDGGGAVFLMRGPLRGPLDVGDAWATLVAPSDGEWVGGSVANAGDVNGDGYQDLVVGAPAAPGRKGLGAGAVYVLLGPVKGQIRLDSAETMLYAQGPFDRAGWSVDGVGDTNGDGYDELLIGAVLSDQGGSLSGAAFLVQGPMDGERSLADADLILVGARGDRLGGVVASAGDVDGTGSPAFLVGAFGSDLYKDDAGALFVLYPGQSGIILATDVGDRLVGEAEGDHAGGAAAGAGDVDGDGYADIVVGAPANGRGGELAGAAYLVFGPVRDEVQLADADAVFLGVEQEYAGGIVAGGEDVDGDGRPDLLIAAPSNRDAGTRAGATYLVHSPETGVYELAQSNVTLLGERAEQLSGGSVAFVGDVDADGLSDVLIGAVGNGSKGTAYLVLGRSL